MYKRQVRGHGHGGFAVGVIGAGEEFSEFSALDDHIFPAFGTADGGDLLLGFADDIAALGIIGAGEILAVFSHAADHEMPAFFTDDVRRFVPVGGGVFQLDVYKRQVCSLRAPMSSLVALRSTEILKNTC